MWEPKLNPEQGPKPKPGDGGVGGSGPGDWGWWSMAMVEMEMPLLLPSAAGWAGGVEAILVWSGSGGAAAGRMTTIKRRRGVGWGGVGADWCDRH
jgi:hypothetical protein